MINSKNINILLDGVPIYPDGFIGDVKVEIVIHSDTERESTLEEILNFSAMLNREYKKNPTMYKKKRHKKFHILGCQKCFDHLLIPSCVL